MSGGGCPKCAIESKKMTKVEYLQKLFRKFPKYEELYDYSNSVYKGSTTPMLILCNTCGKEFSQTPNVHYAGVKCPNCVKIPNIITKEEYLRRLFEKFPENEELYDYEKSDYKGSTVPMLITCKEAGHEFWLTGNSHMAGTGCAKCYFESKKLTHEEYFKNLFERFPENVEKFDYKDAHYIGSMDNMTIICKEYGHVFEQPAHRHYQGGGCPECQHLTYTTKEYIDRVLEKFPEYEGRYDYSNVNYVDSETKILIICENGHEMNVLPGNHYQGHGCATCNGNNKKTVDEFKEQAKIKHEGFYSYDNVDFIDSNTKVEIWCPEHSGYFLQTPHDHLAGSGCGKCRGNLLKTTEEFIQEAEIVHEKRYTYPLADYKGSSVPIKIYCEVHGEFEQPPSSHLAGRGCPDCGGTKLKTAAAFKAEAISIHGDKFNYDNVVYINGSTEVEIYCNTCNKFFMQLPEVHLRSIGCLKCQGRDKTTEEFKEEANVEHNFKYDYSEVIYINATTKVTIKCPCGNVFQQTPNDHLNSKGCSRCNISKGEREIERFLMSNQIDYDVQQTFEDCRGIRNKLPFDFSIFENGTMVGLIEFQGEQHFHPMRYKENPEHVERCKLKFEAIQVTDKIKKTYCENNDINLFEITYKDLLKGTCHIEKMIKQFFPKLFPKQLEMFYENPYKKLSKDFPNDSENISENIDQQDEEEF